MRLRLLPLFLAVTLLFGAAIGCASDSKGTKTGTSSSSGTSGGTACNAGSDAPASAGPDNAGCCPGSGNGSVEQAGQNPTETDGGGSGCVDTGGTRGGGNAPPAPAPGSGN
jgi:hypothetical protein